MSSPRHPRVAQREQSPVCQHTQLAVSRLAPSIEGCRTQGRLFASHSSWPDRCSRPPCTTAPFQAVRRRCDLSLHGRPSWCAHQSSWSFPGRSGTRAFPPHSPSAGSTAVRSQVALAPQGVWLRCGVQSSVACRESSSRSRGTCPVTIPAFGEGNRRVRSRESGPATYSTKKRTAGHSSPVSYTHLTLPTN